MAVPNTFANATTSIPLSQLDQNFATAITLGNTAIQLGNTVTTLNNMTLANVTVSSGNVTVTSLSGAFNGTVGATTANTGAFTTITSTGEAAIGGSSQQVKINRCSDFNVYGAITFNNDFGSTTMSGFYGRGSGGDSGRLFYNVPTGQLHNFTVAGTTVAQISSTGLAVTGTGSFSGASLSVGTAGTGALNNIKIDGSATGEPYYSFYQNGVYKGAVQWVNAISSITVDINGTVRGAFSSTGLAVTAAKTSSGTVNANNNTFVTLFSAASTGMYLVFAYITSGSTSAFQGSATVVTNDNSKTLLSKSVGASFDFQLSGNNVQASQASGGNQDIAYVYLKIA